MFASIEEAVAAHRAGATDHRAAAATMDAARARIQQAEEYLRTHHCSDLVKALTMEWATSNDPHAHTRYRAHADALLHEAQTSPSPAGTYRLGGH